jgi:hypothetical protein
MIDLEKLTASNIIQLALDLDIDDRAMSDDAFVSPEEAQRRSMLAKSAFEVAIKRDEDLIRDAIQKYPRQLSQNELTLATILPKGSVSWSADYYVLIDAGWPWRIAVYIAWACCPRKERYPCTQEELATKHLGLTSDRQVTKWAANPAVREMIGILQAAPLMENRRDVFAALAKSASDPSFHGAADRKTFLTMTGDYIPHQKVDISPEKVDPVELTEAELAKVEKRSHGDSQ